AHDALLEFTSSKLYEESSTQVPEGSGNPNPTAFAFIPPTEQMETLTVESPIPTISSPVPTACLNDSSEPSSEARLVSKRVANQEETPSLDNILSLTNRFEDILGVSTSSDEIIGVEVNLCREFEALMHGKFQMSAMDVRSSNTPMDKENPWGKDGPGKDVELHLYRSMIGYLMYLTASRPDIMFSVCACARHQVTPKECHLHAVKRIFRYLKGHPKLGLWYPKASPFDLVAYSDSDYGGASQDRKSTTGGSQFLGRRLISWQCKKQTINAHDRSYTDPTGKTDVPTGSGFIPTAGPPATIISTGSKVGPTAITRELEEQQEREDMRMNEQIARDTEVARIHAEEEIQGMIDSLDKSNETIAKYLHEYQEFGSELPLEKKIELISDLVKYQKHYTKVHKFLSQQRKPMSKKQKREYYMAVIKSNLG
nr:hypothetical protein [Tanacetum cinerariifolium]